MPATLDQLRQVTEAVLVYLRTVRGVAGKLTMTGYKGFSKSHVPGLDLGPIAAQVGLDPDDLQVEVVHLNQDMSHEIHLHRQATAYIVCLGEAECFSSPRDAWAFLVDIWFPVTAGDIVEIPAGTPHGFTVRRGYSFYFLSVQSPPIVKEGSQDDYVRVETE